MPNRRYNSQVSQPIPSTASQKQADGGRKSVGPIKDSGFAGVPGKTQPRDRSNGVTKRGKLGKFDVKSEGI